MRIYLSGKITGTDDYIERFEEAEREIKNKFPAAEIVNPVKEVMARVTDASNYEKVIAFCLSLEKECDAIYLLRGWEQSNGAQIEHDFAKEHKLIRLVQEEKPWTNTQNIF